MGRFPVNVTSLLVMIHAAMMIIIAVLGVNAAIWDELSFTAPAVVHDAKIWKIVTYAWVTHPSVWGGVGLVCFFLFGREVESFLGRSAFIKLYALLVLLLPLLFCLFALVGWMGFPLVGASAIHFAIFIGLAFIRPDAPSFFMIPLKWLVAFFVTLQTLQFVGLRAWEAILSLWVSMVATYIYLRCHGLPQRFPALEGVFQKRHSLPPHRKSKGYRDSRKKLRALKSAGHAQPTRGPSVAAAVKYEPKLVPRAEVVESDSSIAAIDHLLEKISQQGIASLTAEERQQLQAASSNLANKDKRS